MANKRINQFKPQRLENVCYPIFAKIKNRLQFAGFPIASVSTAVGQAGISVIRTSGTGCIDLVQAVWKGPDLLKKPGNSIHFGRIVDQGQIVDEVLASIFRAPKSYTGEDLVEISCHGGYLNTAKVLSILYKAGFQPAKPGEFTHRAFLNGKMDLTKAEAVADMIHARSEAELENATRQLEGELGGRLQEFRWKLIDFTALIELELDFSEEDVEFARREELISMLSDLYSHSDELLASYAAGQLLRDGVQTAIAGLPNAGKSTLLNTLLQRERAIVSPIPGTTRDTVEAEWSHRGLRFILVDTAGIRHTTDEVERIGVLRSHEALKKADVIVLLADGTDSHQNPEAVFEKTGLKAEDPRVITVLNKQDVLQNPTGNASGFDLTISAKTGSGIAELKDKMFETAAKNHHYEPGRFVLTNARHKHELEALQSSVNRAIRNLSSGNSGELVSLDLRQALTHMGNITGQITTEDLLDSIFSRFCIGK